MERPGVEPQPLEPLERVIADACLGEHAGDALSRDLRAFLEGRGTPPEDVDAATRAPARLAVYRSLVRNGLSGVVLRMLPRTRARMNSACAGRFDADFARFVDEVGPRTHYLRDVPRELYEWAAPRWRSDPAVPAYLPDLASFELAFFAVSASESAGAAREPGELALDRPLAFNGSSHLLCFRWAVHELPAGEASTDVPAERPVRLLAYRDAAHEVRWLELSPLAARLIERLLENEPLRRAVRDACSELGTAPASVLPDVARLLADLAERGVLLGTTG